MLQVSKGISGHGNLTAQRVYYSCYVLGCPKFRKGFFGHEDDSKGGTTS